MNQNQESLARELFDIKSVQFGAFKLKLHENNPGAPLSPIFLNLRTADNPKPGPLLPQLVDKIGSALYELAKAQGVSFTHVAGVPRAGDPFAEAFSGAAEKDSQFVQILHLNKEEGGGRRQVGTNITGSHKPGDQVILIDDLVTKADSKLEAIATLEQAGLKIAAVVVLVDREQGGAQQLREAGYSLLAVFSLGELLDFYFGLGYIDEAKRDEVKTYLSANS